MAKPYAKYQLLDWECWQDLRDGMWYLTGIATDAIILPDEFTGHSVHVLPYYPN